MRGGDNRKQKQKQKKKKKKKKQKKKKEINKEFTWKSRFLFFF